MQSEHTQLIRGLGLIAAISVNVANIIGKLGVADRREAAAVAARLGLV